MTLGVEDESKEKGGGEERRGEGWVGGTSVLMKEKRCFCVMLLAKFDIHADTDDLWAAPLPLAVPSVSLELVHFIIPPSPSLPSSWPCKTAALMTHCAGADRGSWKKKAYCVGHCSGPERHSQVLALRVLGPCKEAICPVLFL